MKKSAKIFLIGGIILLSTSGIFYLINYIQLQIPINEVIKSDYRNSEINVSTHFKNYVFFSTLVFDLREVSSSTRADIFRVLVQYSEKVQKKDFKAIELCYHGKTRFILSGDYFHTMGIEYSIQNPVYTMRTFPEKLVNPDGTRAYSEWTGGWLGVASRQIKDFNDCIEKWCAD